MFRPIIIDPVVFQITLVVASLLAISIWQKLRTTTGIVIGVYSIYMISFVSANNKLDYSKPIRLASHNYNYRLTELKDNITSTTSDAKTAKSIITKDIDISREKIVEEVNKDIDIIKTNTLSEKDPKLSSESLDIPFKVLKMKTGTSVINRTIVDENNAFTTDVERVYFLSGVQNKNDSKILFHKWYHKGTLKSKVKMESKKSYNWRSWSYITVNPQKVGDWQVVIEDQGGIRYDSLSFVINDYSI